jgi:hypothetical protein
MVTYCPTKNLELSGIWKCGGFRSLNFICFNIVVKFTGKPSNFHENCGSGLPAATHFSETVGPGCKVCSENQNISSGVASLNGKD